MPVKAGYLNVRQDLLDAGIEIFEMRPDSVSAKSLIVDDHISMIGTFNLDPRSAHLNTECIVIIDDRTINQQLSQTFSEDWQPDSAWTANPENEKEASLWSRILTRLSALVPTEVL